MMRIASLVPSSTELLFALGLGDHVVAVTHECDFPPEAGSLPHLTATVIGEGLTSAQIDAEVKRVTGEGRALYELNEPRLRELDPELIVTQAVCEVCAVSYDDVRAVADRLPSKPRVLSLDPGTLRDVIADVTRLGAAAGVVAQAETLRRELEGRLAAVRAAVEGAERRSVLALEWLDPPFIGGHWIPEMIDAAGGIDPLAEPGQKSRQGEWSELRDSRPDVVVVMPCGWDTERAALEAAAHAGLIASLGAAGIYAVDAGSSFSRPGPRLIEGTELLAHLLHPDRVEPPAGLDFRRL